MGTVDKIDELRELPAFKNMSSTQVERLTHVMVRRTYAPGQLIFLEGDPVNGVWFIAKGRVRIIKQSLNGRLQGLCMVDKGKCFGGCPLFNGAENPANAQAMDEVTLLILPQEQLQQLIHNDPQLVAALLQVFSQRLAHLARLGEGLGAWTTAHRINDCILAYAEHANPYPVVALTHDKLASLAGTVREVVTRHLAHLEQDGVIRVEPGKIMVVDVDALHCRCLSAS